MSETRMEAKYDRFADRSTSSTGVLSGTDLSNISITTGIEFLTVFAVLYSLIGRNPATLFASLLLLPKAVRDDIQATYF